MSSSRSDKSQLEKFMDMYLQELLDMSDKEALGETDPAVLKEEGFQMLSSAKAEAGKRRLAVARDHLASVSTSIESRTQNISVEEARAYLKKAVNDPRFTLAARELGEMSDADVMLLYQQIRFLEEQNNSNSDS